MKSTLNESIEKPREIKFKNACPIPDWMPEYKKKFRQEANQFFSSALEQVPFLKDTDIEVTYFLRGHGSIVAKIETSSGETYVMKTTESVNHTSNEICTYKASHDAGIKVPKLFFDGVQDGLPFFLMEYFDTGTLADSLEKGQISADDVSAIKNEFFCTVKKIQGRGYCWSVSYEDGVLQGNFKDINEYVDKWFGDEEFLRIAQTHMPQIAWEQEFKFHANKLKAESDDMCRLGIFDFQTDHVFASSPPTMFDMSMRLEPEYFDLAQLIIPFPDRDEGSVAMNKSLFAKYQEAFGQIDFEKLYTAVWLQSYRKATNYLKHSDEQRTKSGLHILQVISDGEVLRGWVEGWLDYKV